MYVQLSDEDCNRILTVFSKSGDLHGGMQIASIFDKAESEREHHKIVRLSAKEAGEILRERAESKELKDPRRALQLRGAEIIKESLEATA